MRNACRSAIVITALAALVAPAAASAATKITTAGPPLKHPPPGVPKYSDATQFYPKTTTVRVGDTVDWKFFGFHSVYFPKKGGGNASFVRADPTLKYNDKDPAGNPFYFNGRPQLIANPAAVFALGGKSYNGTRVTSSGVPDPEKRSFSYKLKFIKAGSYTYFCTIHPKMKGTVRVKGKSAGVPSAKADKRAVARQVATTIAELKRNDKRRSASGNVIEVGRDTTNTSLLNFFPQKRSVPVGTPVEFRMSPSTNELHTVTFGSAVVLGTGGYAEKLGRSLLSPLPGTGQNGPPKLGIPGPLFFPSDQGALSFDGSQHGGFLNSGGLGEPPLARRKQFTFTKAGTYTFVCLIHPEMRGLITAQ
jgi:plastocyanin